VGLAEEVRLVLDDAQSAGLSIVAPLAGLLRAVAERKGPARHDALPRFGGSAGLRAFNDFAPLAVGERRLNRVEHLAVRGVLGRAREEFHLPEGVQLGQEGEAEVPFTVSRARRDKSYTSTPSAVPLRSSARTRTNPGRWAIVPLI